MAIAVLPLLIMQPLFHGRLYVCTCICCKLMVADRPLLIVVFPPAYTRASHFPDQLMIQDGNAFAEVFWDYKDPLVLKFRIAQRVHVL